MIRETGGGDESRRCARTTRFIYYYSYKKRKRYSYFYAGGSMTGLKINEDGGTADTISATSGNDVELNFGLGLNKSVSGTAVATTSELASDSNAGIASFDATDFSVAGSGENAVTLNAERIQDIAGAMVTGNTETGITVTYQDADGTIDLLLV